MCRVTHQATMRTGQLVSSQWICELLPGAYVKILELDTHTTVGRQRALVKAQLSYIKGWISIRTARGSYLVARSADDERGLFDLPGSMHVCGCEMSADPGGLAGVLRNLACHIKRQPDFGTLTSADFVMSQRLQSLFRLASGGDTASLDSQRLRWNLWATLSPNRNSPEGLAILAAVLLQIRESLLELDKVFMRLHEEFVCLEDTDAEVLFSATGETQAAASRAKQISEKCRRSQETLGLPSSSWFDHLPNPVSVVSDLESREQALLEFQSAVTKLTSQRRVLVARVKAAVEARAATEAVSAASLLADALRPDTRLDFPLVTELCERATSDPAELAEVVDALSCILDESVQLQQRLKALTVTNELMYDDAARQAFAQKPGFSSALMHPISSIPSDTCPSIAYDLAAANVQLLTTEIARRISAETNVSNSACLAAAAAKAAAPPSPGVPKPWLASVAHTPGRQTGQPEHLSWPHTRDALNALRASLQSGSVSTRDATSVLDRIYRCLDEAMRRISQLRASLDHTISQDVGELIEDLSLSAARINSSVLEWKCRAVDALDTADEYVDGTSQWSPSSRRQRRLLGKLLDRAESIGDSLNACLTILLARRSPTDVSQVALAKGCQRF
ncbi:unnamed protein product [Symbiodinium sp. CCMP2592]|nr:unnamed protein product [Symbiodinium sp. CCMP2592]